MFYAVESVVACFAFPLLTRELNVSLTPIFFSFLEIVENTAFVAKYSVIVFSSFQGKIEGGLDNAMVTRQMFYKVHYINLVFHSINDIIQLLILHSVMIYGFVVNSMLDTTLDGFLCPR